MAVRIRSLVGALAAAFALAACGGGGGGGGTSVPFQNPTPPPGSVTVSPATLAFAGPGSAPQSITITSSVPGVPAPAIDPIGCSPVASFSTSSATLPATYTVTPLGNGSCALVVRVGSQAATLGVTVGGGGGAPVLTQSTNTINIFVGGTAGTVTVSASSGTLTPDASACAGIAAIGGSGGASPQTFSIAPLAAGNCTLVVVDGASTVLVPIAVSPNPNGNNALFIAPSTLEFASPNAAAQQANLTFNGNAGQVGINEDDCIGNTGKPKIAFLTLTGVPPGTPVSLPQNVTVTPYGGVGSSGTCSIIFTSTAGAAQAVLNVIVH